MDRLAVNEEGMRLAHRLSVVSPLWRPVDFLLIVDLHRCMTLHTHEQTVSKLLAENLLTTLLGMSATGRGLF